MSQLSPLVSLDSDGQTPPREIDVVQNVLDDYAEYRGVADPFTHLNRAAPNVDGGNLIITPSQHALTQEWNKRDPQTAVDVDTFYKEQEAYVEDLTWFNAQVWYWRDVESTLRKWGKVADFGGGIGSLAMVLTWLGNAVHYVDLPSPQRTFAEWRFKRHELPISVHDSLEGLRDLDAIACIDTVEHLHPDTYADVTRQMRRALKREGQLLMLGKFGSDKRWPMHYDTKELFYDALKRAGFNGIDRRT